MKDIKQKEFELFYGKEPFWWEEHNLFFLDDGEINSIISNSYRWYNYAFDYKDAKQFVLEYMVLNIFSDKDILKVKALPEWKISKCSGWIARMILQGCKQMPKSKIEYLEKKIDHYLKSESNPPQLFPVNTEPDCNVKRVLTKLVNQINTLEIEDDIFDVDRALKILNITNIKQCNTAIIYLKSYIKNNQSFISTHEKLLEALVRTKSKYDKPKPLSSKLNINSSTCNKTKSLNLKFKEKSDEISILKSIDSINIFTSNNLWLYDDKTRFLIYYFITPPKKFDVKGSTLIDYDSQESFKIKLRKPSDFFSNFFTSRNKAKLIESLSTKRQSIKTGRLNKNHFLLTAS